MAIASTRHPYEQLSRSASGIGSTPWWLMAAALVFSVWAHNTHAVVLHTHIGAPHCADVPTAPAALAHIAQDLQVQGLALDACCEARSGGWIVRVRVMDGMKARQTVRGPLADGEDVDMGTPSGVVLAGASGGADGFAPDVQHNRQWLRTLMAQYRFENSADAWWLFVQQGTLPPAKAGKDFAAR